MEMAIGPLEASTSATDVRCRSSDIKPTPKVTGEISKSYHVLSLGIQHSPRGSTIAKCDAIKSCKSSKSDAPEASISIAVEECSPRRWKRVDMLKTGNAPDIFKNTDLNYSTTLREPVYRCNYRDPFNLIHRPEKTLFLKWLVHYSFYWYIACHKSSNTLRGVS